MDAVELPGMMGKPTWKQKNSERGDASRPAQSSEWSKCKAAARRTVLGDVNHGGGRGVLGRRHTRVLAHQSPHLRSIRHRYRLGGAAAGWARNLSAACRMPETSATDGRQI